MNFQSLHFVIFLSTVVFAGWGLRNHPGSRKNLLLVASYYFYAAWDWRCAGLLAVMTAVNYSAGRAIASTTDARQRKAWLIFAVLVCLGILGFFKYSAFFVDGLIGLIRSMGYNGDIGTIQLLLPIGISFFTFQSLSYVLDIYRRQAGACHSVRDFALFVAFFPTVLAGPITRARFLLPQFERLQPQEPHHMDTGLALVVRGFVKKVAFADVLAVHLVNPAFDNPAGYSSLFLLLALYAYTFQIYMDVSGYTDIARGAAAMCGFRLPENFDRPYIAPTISNFWQRWHISMSSFFRDYLYFGMGGSKHGNVYVNLLLTFIAIGVWHGAGWNFVVYGFIHGGVVCIERWRRDRRIAAGLPPEADGGLRRLSGIVLTFHIVVFSRVLFRAQDLSAAADFLGYLFRPASTLTPLGAHAIGVLAIAAALHWFAPRAGTIAVSTYTRLPAIVQGAFLVILTLSLTALSTGTAPFVYFQF